MDTTTQRDLESRAERMDKPGDVIGTKLPSSAYLGAMAGSVLLSLGLYASGRKEAAIFVGEWAPTFLLFGLYNKIVRLSHGITPATEQQPRYVS